MVKGINHKEPHITKPEPDEILDRLLEGNRRFADGKSIRPRSDISRRELSAQSSQSDYAVATILSCSDSRMPPEIIFDCGIMDLFVVRLAGNVLCNCALASIEYGILHVHTPILMVLAHSQCGAVTAVVNSLQEKGDTQNEEDTHLHELFKYITPVVQSVIQNEKHPADIQQFINLCACEHARNIVQKIREISKHIAEAEQLREIKIIPAFYELETGRVFCLD